MAAVTPPRSRKHGPARRKEDQSAPAQAATGETPVFHFKKFSVVRLVFQEVRRPEGAGAPAPGTYRLELRVSAGVSLLSGGNAEVKLGIALKSDPLVKPYEIELDVVGLFDTPNGTPEQLIDFCRSVAPNILFPYIRQVIDKTTSDGRYGEVRLDPANLSALLPADQWVEEPRTTKSDKAAAADKIAVE
jgi:preprotein translocase subunit SecB